MNLSMTRNLTIFTRLSPPRSFHVKNSLIKKKFLQLSNSTNHALKLSYFNLSRICFPRRNERKDKVFPMNNIHHSSFHPQKHKVFNFFHVPLKASSSLQQRRRNENIFFLSNNFFSSQFFALLHQAIFEDFFLHPVHHFSRIAFPIFFHFAEISLEI